MGVVFEWPELLFFSLLTVYAMNWEPTGVPLPLFIFIAAPFAVRAACFLLSRADPRKYRSARNNWITAAGAVIALVLLAFTTPTGSWISVALAIAIAVVWGFFVLRILEVYSRRSSHP